MKTKTPIRTAEELSDCLLRNDPTSDHWKLDFSGAHAMSGFERCIHSIVLHAPHSNAVRSIDLSLRKVSAARAAGIAEMLSLLPNLRRFSLEHGTGTEVPVDEPIRQTKKLTETARLVVSGLARNEKSSLRHFFCEVDCGPEAIMALFVRHSELERVQGRTAPSSRIWSTRKPSPALVWSISRPIPISANSSFSDGT